MNPDWLQYCSDAMTANDSATRYWGAMGFLMQGKDGVAFNHDILIDALEDPSDQVKIVAAEAIGRYGAEVDDLVQALPILGEPGGLHEVRSVHRHGRSERSGQSRPQGPFRKRPDRRTAQS